MNPVNGITALPGPQVNPVATGNDNSAKSSFGELLSSTLESANSTQLTADKAIENFVTGDAKHLHEVMISVEEADISLRMLVQIRNKALTAYEEIMRMQI
ncbi:MAG: flagellar hook-basal body complex protein FliE [Deltaproteobacteria bacterium]|nr:flagellar hook-basal body complex protein FliE [Deltaproteobacteria bacterium]MBW2660300.1 flagellar hook-basal body complex protein FliE [Deltaproteobacteria bacterium]